MDIKGKLNQANGRLRAAKVGVTIEQQGGKLCLRATLPPKPNSGKTKPHQQRISLGIGANPGGLKLAEAEARKVGALRDCGEFDWSEYLEERPDPERIGDWVAKFEKDYFHRRQRTPKTETTWKTDYQAVFDKLPNEPIGEGVLKAAALATAPDTKTRKRTVIALSKLADFAGIEHDLKRLVGSYSPSQVQPRDIPGDELIARTFKGLPNGSWKWAYGVMATYGLRNHEVFYLDLSEFPLARVEEGKTGKRLVYPLYPEWAKDWNLDQVDVPNCTGKTNRDLGQRVTKAFKRSSVPFSPYNLRHAWAVRSLEFGLDISLAAAQMGHSVQVHSQVYHHWLSEDVHRRAFEKQLANPDRPLPPLTTGDKSF